MNFKKDYYQILGVNPNAAPSEIRRAYRRLAILYHPDRNPSPQSNEKMREVNEAYSVIGDQEKRAEYDHKRLISNTKPLTGTPKPYSRKEPFSRTQPTSNSASLISSSFFVLLLAFTIALLSAMPIFKDQSLETPVDDLNYFDNATTFLVNNSTIGPINAPFSGTTSLINVEEYGFTIKPGIGTSAIAVGNVINDSLPSDLFVDGQSYSNLNFEFAKNIRGFGFAVESVTCEDYRGESNFVVTLKQDGVEVGTVRFSTPADGFVFVAFVSKVSFNSIELVESEGGPENQTESGGCADRESFGNFYIVP